MTVSGDSKSRPLIEELVFLSLLFSVLSYLVGKTQKNVMNKRLSYWRECKDLS